MSFWTNVLSLSAWRRNLVVGSACDALDYVNMWYTGVVKEISCDRLLIHFDDWAGLEA